MINNLFPAPDGSWASKEVSGGVLPISQSHSHKRSRPANDLQQAICHQPAPEEASQATTSQTAERVTHGQHVTIHHTRHWICFKYSIKYSSYLFLPLPAAICRHCVHVRWGSSGRFLSIFLHSSASLNAFKLENNWRLFSVMKYLLSFFTWLVRDKNEYINVKATHTTENLIL